MGHGLYTSFVVIINQKSAKKNFTGVAVKKKGIYTKKTHHIKQEIC
jgi:hypothetical protein